MRRTTFAPLLLGFCLAAHGACANEDPVPDAAPSVEVDRTALTPAIGIFPDKEWGQRPLLPPVDLARFNSAVDQAFATPQPADMAETRALVVIQNGTLVYERYADGFGPATRFFSWSVAKSITHALTGVGVRDGLLDLDEPVSVSAWSDPADLRKSITPRHLLTNTSGLAWRSVMEAPAVQSDESVVLFGTGRDDTAAFVSQRKLDSEPGTLWEYNSGNFNLMSAVITNTLTTAGTPSERRKAMHAFMSEKLFEPLGITSAIGEFDQSGTFLGGSSVFMTARDYARFGLLYLRGGKWAGEQILPEGWTDFAATPLSVANETNYGAGFWINSGVGPQNLPGLPETTYQADGNDGQVILIVPSHQLVIVRLGKTPWQGRDEIAAFLQNLALCFPERTG